MGLSTSSYCNSVLYHMLTFLLFFASYTTFVSGFFLEGAFYGSFFLHEKGTEGPHTGVA
jgi:hypothetical protein